VISISNSINGSQKGSESAMQARSRADFHTGAFGSDAAGTPLLMSIISALELTTKLPPLVTRPTSGR
jgi:hypothetical protein